MLFTASLLSLSPSFQWKCVNCVSPRNDPFHCCF